MGRVFGYICVATRNLLLKSFFRGFGGDGFFWGFFVCHWQSFLKRLAIRFWGILGLGGIFGISGELVSVKDLMLFYVATRNLWLKRLTLQVFGGILGGFC